MSGLEWLAVPPILESTVKAIFKAYMLNKAALETFDDAGRAVSDLELCHLRLVFWLIASGMVSTQAPATKAPTTEASEKPVMQKFYALVLAEIQSYFTELQTIFAIYKFPINFADDQVGSADASRVSAPSGWTINSIKALQGRVISKLREDMSYHRKLKFQIQHKKRVDELLSRLWRYLDMLIGMLPAADRLQWDVEDRGYTMDRIAQKSVNELLAFEQEAAAQGDSVHATCYLTAATFKQAKEEYNHHLDALSGLRPQRPYSTLLKNTLLRLEPSQNPESSARQLGTLIAPDQEPRQVLVELKKKRDRSGILLIQQAEVNLLCALLSCKSSDVHPDLRVLQCLGHIAHPTESNYFVIVFVLPPNADFALPMTLYNLLSVRRAVPEQLPTLDSRRGLAIRLAKAVWRLHQYGWFHKGLNSSNILFFPAQSAQPDLQKDFFLAGFDNMRLQTSVNLTNTDSAADKANRANLYRHPAFLDGVTEFSVEDGYAPAFDLWSLGIILCEIAMWTPVDSGKFVRGRENTYMPARLAQILTSQPGEEDYKHSPVSELAHRMGTPYWRAVVNCFGAEDHAKDYRWIAENIIRPLVQASNDPS